MKKLFALSAILVLTFSACTQTTPTDAPEDEIKVDDEVAVVDEAPADYEGVWLRTAVYINGALEHQVPATLTLNKDDYVSTGTCINTGQVIAGEGNTLTMTLDSTNCEGVSAGGSFTLSYSMEFDEEKDVEVMTNVTGPVTETYDRQS